ncbi:hypothetical protein ALQ84_200062 [Pseudomonas caricapapayae]|uniref:Uncharacterized protein n=1 Tax=Pseudomonas caricapapayae TaxID=46678 RepID=A0A3M3AXE3_9PSED|nr:hypothetical protein ALQ84_200062 [Pseudomonas caricapapayae]RMV92500.1 hypothetical protein ALP01_200131 [Pseudomonas caricapapayae]
MRHLAVGGHQSIGIMASGFVGRIRGHGFTGDTFQSVIGVANFHLGVVERQQRLAVEQRVFQIDGPGVAVQCAAQGLGSFEHGFGLFSFFHRPTQGLAVGKAGQGADAVERERIPQGATVAQRILRLLNVEMVGGVQGRFRVALHPEQRLAGEHQPGL